MAILTFREIASLVNHSKTIEIAETPRLSAEGEWDIYDGVYRIHGREFKFVVLYLFSRATTSGFRSARQALKKADDAHVVYAESLGDRSAEHVDKFKDIARRVETPREYLASFMRDELFAYMQKIGRFQPSNYIEPKLDTPSKTRLQRPNPVESFLLDPASQSTDTSGMLATVLAEPGQGKTFMCEHLVQRLASRHQSVIPILVRSDQWEDIKLEELSSLWKTLSHVFRHEDTPIAWVSGCEELFFRTTLKAGLFRVIFDGFDEYILRNQGRVEPSSILDLLQELVRETGARIVVTSRTSFWNTEIKPTLHSSDTSDVSIYKIAPFDQNHAREYFKNRITVDEKVNAASEMFATLRKKAKNLAGRGFVLRLVADLYTEEDEIVFDEPPDSARIVTWLMKALCERDTRRQNLPVGAPAQLTALQGFVADIVRGESPSQELLHYHLSLAEPSLTDDLVRQCSKGMEAHPLITRSSPGVWEISQDQVVVSLLAEYIQRCSIDGEVSDLRSLNAGNMQEALLRDVAYLLLDTVQAENNSDESRIEGIKVLVGNLYRSSLDISPASRGLFGRLVGFLLVRSTEQLGQSLTHKEKTDFLLEIAPSEPLRVIAFLGTMNGFDFRAVRFEECVFYRTRFVNCEFDEDTVFHDCHFVGIDSVRSDSLGRAQFHQLTSEDGAKDTIDRLRSRAGKKQYSASDLQTDIENVITKFISKGGTALRTVEESHLSAGVVGASPHRDDILELVKRRLLERHSISSSGKARGWHVNESAKESVQFFAANNVFSGPLRAVFDELKRKLDI